MFGTRLTIAFLAISVACFSQDTTIRLSPYFRATFPAAPDSMETQGLTVYSLNTDSVYYQALMAGNRLNINSEEDFVIGLKGMYHGFEPKVTGYAVQKNDTTIGGVKGLFVYAVSKDDVEDGRQLFSFFTIIDGHCCMIQCSTLLNAPALRGVEEFFRTARFKGENYPTVDETSIAFRVGQVLGYILIVAFVYFFYRLVRKYIIKL